MEAGLKEKQLIGSLSTERSGVLREEARGTNKSTALEQTPEHVAGSVS